jgi:hypothetical protein
MDIHDTETADKFDTKDECRQWINDRVVRFKLRMVRARTPEGKLTYIPQKCDGKIVVITSEGFKRSGTDEPLSNYAAPMRQDDKWFAVMKLRG